ncbi:hypothetical protein [Parafrankia discariae]|uniref:hypothetical protein n=1 Tax=Parafrankia discariae TaxID=365528 RepID=UPI0003783A68|nr:hypothetical protein [Parafrankia discariae]
MAGRPAWLRGESWRIAEPPLTPAATGAAVLGAVVLVVGCFLTAGSDFTEGSTAATPVGVEVDQSPLASWYTSTQGMRGSIATSVASARAYLDAQDGASLRPLCVQLAAEGQQAGGLTPGPDPEAQRLFTSGAGHYETAARTCAQLFDGTRVPAAQLQAQVREALADGDRDWDTLATRVGLPMATAQPTPPAATGSADSTDSTGSTDGADGTVSG